MFKVALLVTLALLVPTFCFADVAKDLHSMQDVLTGLYKKMLPSCKDLIKSAQLIGGFGALWYIGARVWKHIAAAEPVDIYPLLRPFALGFCISIFPQVMDLFNGVLAPIEAATYKMAKDNRKIIDLITKNREAEEVFMNSSDPSAVYKYDLPNGNDPANPANTQVTEKSGFWDFKAAVRRCVADVFGVIFEAAALVLSTIRTFKMIILTILGPIVFALSIFDGFQQTLKQWMARYVNVFMWLPVANIYGTILFQIQANAIGMADIGTANVSTTNTAYLIFLILGIAGYWAVPSTANYIISAGGSSPLVGRALGAVAAVGGAMVSVGAAKIAGQSLKEFLKLTGGKGGDKGGGGNDKGGGSGEGGGPSAGNGLKAIRGGLYQAGKLSGNNKNKDTD